MLKQSPSRTQRSRGFKVKHVLQACVLLVVSIWLLNQLKHSYYEKAEVQHGAEDTSGKGENELELLKLGRKDIHPRFRVEDMEGLGDKEEVEEEVDEIKPEVLEDEGRGGGDDEIDGHDQERSDEEPEEVEDLIDVDDRDREEVSELQESDEKDRLLEDGSSKADQDKIEGIDIMRMEQFTSNRVSANSMEQGIRTVTSKPETVSMRRMKETEDLEIELVQTKNSIDDTDGAIDSDPKSRKNVTAEPIHDPNSLDEADSSTPVAAVDA